MKRTFIPGDTWLYFKIYCGVKTQDEVLTEIVAPFAIHLISENIINQWFFIRYGDPNQHLRLRFCCTSPASAGYIINQLNNNISPWVNRDLVNRIQIDTYQRELERYGESTIEDAENIFYHDSTFVVNILNLIEGDEGEEIRWLAALKSIDGYLDLAGYSIGQKLDFLAELKQLYGKEHGLDKNLDEQLSGKYRLHKRKIEEFLLPTPQCFKEYEPIYQCIRERDKRLEPVFNNLKNKLDDNSEVNFHDLMISFLHMSNNRLFRTKQRLHELVLYDLLKKNLWSASRRISAPVK